MNVAATVNQHDDGYVQDEASQWVAALVGAKPGDRVLDVCAPPGGKATAMAGFVVAADVPVARAALIAENARPARLRAAGRRGRRRPAAAHPCTVSSTVSSSTPRAPAFSTLRRRPDARWRIHEADVDRLTALQRELLAQAVQLVAPGGVLVYSVCTLTAAEWTDVSGDMPARTAAAARPAVGAVRHRRPPPPPSRRHRRHVRLPLACRRVKLSRFPVVVTLCRSWSSGTRQERRTGQLRCRRVALTTVPVGDAGQGAHGVGRRGGRHHEDRSGAALAEALERAGFEVVDRQVVGDGAESVAAALQALCTGFTGLVVTTGGTGFGPLDPWPDPPRAVLEREAPGLAEAVGLVKPLGRLEPGHAGTIGQALVLNTPGSSSGAVEYFEAVADIITHAIDLLGGGRPH